jgi:hypothetical protein
MSAIEFYFYESKYVLNETYKEKVDYLGEGSIKPDSLKGFFRVNILRLDNQENSEIEIFNLMLVQTKDESYNLCIKNKIVKVQDATTAVSIIRDVYFPHTSFSIKFTEKAQAIYQLSNVVYD